MYTGTDKISPGPIDVHYAEHLWPLVSFVYNTSLLVLVLGLVCYVDTIYIYIYIKDRIGFVPVAADRYTIHDCYILFDMLTTYTIYTYTIEDRISGMCECVTCVEILALGHLRVFYKSTPHY